MFSFVGYSKKGLPHSLIHVHDILIKDFVVYFEKGKECRRGIKKIRKAVKKAFKIAKKQKINPAESIGEAREVLEALWVEIELTRKALLATSTRLKDALHQIQQERIDRPLSLVEEAREHFRNKEIEQGLELLKQTQAELEKKVLITTRTVLFAGTSNEVKDLKDKIEEHRKQKSQRKNKNKEEIPND